MIEKILERFYNIDPQEMMTEEQRNVLRYCTEIVQEVAKEYKDEYEMGFEDGAESVRALVPYEDGWIPCSKRLPNNTDNVLITTRYGVVLMVFLGMSKNWCYLNGKRITDSQDMPIAWQPLPAPFRRESKP